MRTLLLNQPASSETPVGEYVPPMFRAVLVPVAIQKARNLLFGPRPDTMMLDYRLRQYMAMLHATELAEFVTVDDPRITYVPGGRDMTDFDPTPSALPVGHNNTLYVVGDWPTAIDGRMIYAWQVTVLIASVPSPVVAITRRSPTVSSTAYDLIYTSGLSNTIPLDGSPLSVRFNDDVSIVDGTTWNVNCLAMPSMDPGQIAATIGTTGANILGELFGFASEEPYRTWSALWESDQPLPYRLGAVLLAVAARTDDIRTGAN